METTIEHEREIRGITSNIPFYEIGEKGSLLPMTITNENNEPIEVIFCESISDGISILNNIPKSLSLTILKNIDGKLHSFKATYSLTIRSLNYN